MGDDDDADPLPRDLLDHLQATPRLLDAERKPKITLDLPVPGNDITTGKGGNGGFGTGSAGGSGAAGSGTTGGAGGTGGTAGGV